ncbi:MAG: hypothetical protein US15_C0012G0004 [Candidatus Moranbacteria bacterium GW2011_GWF1_36_4]|nr:MAG: hypothetical protein US15_C0012G0004 [Candidatus Moranbacteria bacterium GW2011_GWF1_36_4]
MTSILERARIDTQSIITNTADFSVAITLKNPSGTITAVVSGIASKHHISIDTQGNVVNARTAKVTFCEKQLTDLAYPVRTSGEVTLIKHIIEYQDSTNVAKKYIIRETFPDETLGIIVCILGDYE